MVIDENLTASLVEFYSIEQIRAMWRQAFEAQSSRSTTVIHINQSAGGGSSHGGIALSSPQEMSAFIAACRSALKQKGGDLSTDPATLGTVADFSQRIVAV